MAVSDEMVLAGAKALHEEWRASILPGGSNHSMRGIIKDETLFSWENLHPENRESYLRTSRTALTAALSDQVEDWQPIETAPKIEGVYVDLWFPQRIAGEYDRVPDCLWIAKTTTPGWYADCAHSDEIYYLGDGATHWRYRPESPVPASTPVRVIIERRGFRDEHPHEV